MNNPSENKESQFISPEDLVPGDIIRLVTGELVQITDEKIEMPYPGDSNNPKLNHAWPYQGLNENFIAIGTTGHLWLAPNEPVEKIESPLTGDPFTSQNLAKRTKLFNQ